MKQEEWKTIPDFTGFYEASSHGRIRSVHRITNNHGKAYTVRQRILRPSTGGGGHKRVILRRDGYEFTRNVHRLVLEAFVGPCPAGLECCHDDDDPAKNNPENLRWDTRTSNLADRTKNGKSNRGERHGNSKLTEERVRQARFFYDRCGMSYNEIGKMYGVSGAAIRYAVKRITWFWLDREG